VIEADDEIEHGAVGGIVDQVDIPGRDDYDRVDGWMIVLADRPTSELQCVIVSCSYLAEALIANQTD
jgi:hypothetical protein